MAQNLLCWDTILVEQCTFCCMVSYSDSTHHFFRNACTKSRSLRFSQFSGCWLILSVYIIMRKLSVIKTMAQNLLCWDTIPHIFQTKFKKVRHATPRNKWSVYWSSSSITYLSPLEGHCFSRSSAYPYLENLWS
jgi:hypothetical protein